MELKSHKPQPQSLLSCIAGTNRAAITHECSAEHCKICYRKLLQQTGSCAFTRSMEG